MVSKFDIIALSGVSAGDIFHFQIDDAGSISIGRATECDLVLQDPMVSRKHLSIEKRTDGFYMVDQGSTHGTFHMGFHLKAGADNARIIHDEDEFKIGEMLFRVAFDETEFAAAEKVAKKPELTSRMKANAHVSRFAKKKFIALGALALISILSMVFLPSDQGGLPKQKSKEILSVPNFAVIGYFNSPETSARKGEKDFSHLDMAQFDIPASDVLIELDYTGETSIDVRLDDVSVGKFEPSPGSWQIRHFVIRGVALGKLRRLVFDNLDFPKKPGDLEKPKRWAIRDIRATPLTRSYGVEEGFGNSLRSTIGMVESIDKNPEGMFLLIRALQTSLLELIKELKIDAVQYQVNPGAEAAFDPNNIGELVSRLESVRNNFEQASTAGSETSGSIKEVSSVISQLEAELWRRVNNRMMQARQESKVKNYIDAHDELMSGMKMFPAEADYRWSLLNRMYLNKKIIPKRVRDDPKGYRK